MIYPVGYKFIAGQSSTQRGGSVIQNINESQRVQNTTNKSNFESGQPYAVYYIKPIKEGDKSKLQYIFNNLNTKQTFEMVFGDTGEADTYIAKVSGQLNEYRAIRTALNTPDDKF